ncbi:TIM-barrel domain-containing protein [Sinomonas gamaensis]|uniref:glycoside hydrolase family 31 protein n=1 Tax=Sinomonas gamaensis TaxID=2565624 RepID=UPI0011082DD7|nr:TIM-barrel domain-containing protein [Sinomonas gamaensis]
MIRHRPYGSGHPYTDDTDQRSPIRPIAGQQVRLGVRTSPDITEVSCEVQEIGPDGHAAASATPAERVATASRGQIIDGGHLASAQARLARASSGWQTTISGLDGETEYRYRFTGLTESGETQSTRWFAFRPATWTKSATALQVEGRSRVLGDSVEILHSGGSPVRVRFALPLAAAERVTGFGERYDALDHTGRKLDAVVFEQYKSQGQHRRTYLPMPFAHVVGGEGWGFHVDTSRRTWFDIAASTPERLIVEADLDETADPEAVLLTVRFFDGSPSEVLTQFLDRVGRPKELPEWVFKLWASGNEWNTQAEVMRQMDLHRRTDIPVGVVVIEAWSDESTFTAFRDAQYNPTEDGSPLSLADFTFPAEGAWPDPKGMVDELHDRDVRVVLWQIPLLKMRPHPKGQARFDADAAVREGRVILEQAPDGTLRPYRNRGWWFPLALMPDLTDAEAARWWTEKRRYLVEEVGIDGFKTDGGEHAWGRDLQYLNGRRGDEANNLFPVAYARAYGDLLESAGKAPVTFSRAGFTGSQAHGAFWAGDENSSWDAFRWSLYAGLSAGSSGILYWGWDFAGFSGEIPTAELYLRSAEAAAFVPIMQYHSEFNHHRKPSHDRTPWNIQERTGDDRVIPIFRELTHLRERLIPYLAHQARASIEHGTPLMKPLFFDHPSDPGVWERPLQWMLGEDLLVSPVTEEGATQWTTYLPEGEWVDVWSGQRHQGKLEVTTQAPLGRVPVFSRESAWPEMKKIFRAE